MPSIYFTDAELLALQDWFPRVAVANSVRNGSPEYTAIEKIAPRALPSSTRHYTLPNPAVEYCDAPNCPGAFDGGNCVRCDPCYP